MKAMRTPDSREIERLAQMTSDAYTDALDDTIAQFICMTCRYFGLGHKRANAFMRACAEMSGEYKQYIDDGILTDKLKEELKMHGIDPDDVYLSKNDVKFEVHMAKKKRENQVGFAEAMRRQQELANMKEFLWGERNDGQAKIRAKEKET